MSYRTALGLMLQYGVLVLFEVARALVLDARDRVLIVLEDW